MLTAVLRTERAIAASISIMEAFVEMRHFIANNAALFDRISKVELTQLEFQKHTEERKHIAIHLIRKAGTLQ